MTQLSSSWADGKTVFALGIRIDAKQVVLPTPAAIRNGSYPLARPLNVVTDGPPRGESKALIDFLLGPRGQALMVKHGYLTLQDAGAGRK
jgi:phosphate transport system substrate-binding protein